MREQETQLLWLNHDADEKLAFFQEHIMPYRKTTTNEFNNLKAFLSQDISNMALLGVDVADSIPKTGGVKWTFFHKKQVNDIQSKSQHLSAGKK